MIIDQRKASLRPGDVCIHHDFTEAITLVHQGEIQSNHFGGNATVSIEGYTAHYLDPVSQETKFDFHSYLSDDKTQIASTVHCHMTKLVNFLRTKDLLPKGARLMGGTDGCAKQFRCSTAIFFMSWLAVVFGIIVDRDISTSAYGKGEVDAINGVNKSILYRLLLQQNRSAKDADKEDISSLKFHSYQEVDGVNVLSPAEECKKAL